MNAKEKYKMIKMLIDNEKFSTIWYCYETKELVLKVLDSDHFFYMFEGIVSDIFESLLQADNRVDFFREYITNSGYKSTKIYETEFNIFLNK